MKLKSLLEKYEELNKIANEAYDASEKDPDNEELEMAFDKAYEEEFAAFEEAANEIVNLTSGQIDIKTARTMIRTKKEQILNLMEMVG